MRDEASAEDIARRIVHDIDGGPELHEKEIERELAHWTKVISSYGDRRAREAAEWRPIETVPRDGRLVDLWVQSLGLKGADSDEMRVYVEFRVPDAMWFDNQWCDEMGNPHPYLEGFAPLRFTHWRSPPPAPGEERMRG